MGADGSQMIHGQDATASRLPWVDYAKGIGICLVVYGHVARGLINAGLARRPETLWWIDGVIYAFHMPLFFVLAGLFFFDSLEKHGGTGFALGKIDTLLYPYVLWSLLQGAVEVFMSSVTNHRTSWSDVLGLVWEPRAQFWFLYGLFFCSLAALLVRVALSAAGKVMIAAVCVVVGLWLFFRGAWGLDVAVFRYVAGYMVYFSLGMLLGLWKRQWRNFASVSLAVLAGLLAAAGFDGFDGERSSALLFGIAGLMVVILISWVLSRFRIRILSELGEYSLAIYLVHVLIGSGVRIVLQRFLGVESLAVHLLLGCLSGVFFSYWIAKELALKKINWVFSVPPGYGIQALVKRMQPTGRA